MGEMAIPQLCRWKFYFVGLADFIRLKLNYKKNKKSLFEPPSGDLGVTYALYLRLPQHVDFKVAVTAFRCYMVSRYHT